MKLLLNPRPRIFLRFYLTTLAFAVILITTLFWYKVPIVQNFVINASLEYDSATCVIKIPDSVARNKSINKVRLIVRSTKTLKNYIVELTISNSMKKAIYYCLADGDQILYYQYFTSNELPLIKLIIK